MTSPTPPPTTLPTGPPTGTSASPSTSPSATPPTTAAESALLAAVQDALAAEQQAVWGYPVLGPRLTDAGQIALARACDDAHATLAGVVATALVGVGRTPVAPAVEYPVPAVLDTPAQAVAYALDLEQACAAAWRFVVVRGGDGTDVAGVKATAVEALSAGAVRAARWRAVGTPTAPTVAFPGT